MKKKLLIFISLLLMASCAKIPMQSVTLTDAIMKEGNRMHQLNITLINKMFKEKREKIDDFIENEYTPKFLEEFNERIPEGVDIEAELPKILKSIIPEINARRDRMQSALEEQRVKLIAKLEQDYHIYENATTELKDLLESAVKVGKERKELFNMVKELSNDKIDLNQVESSLDRFIIDSGNLGKDILNLNESINSIINK